MSIHSKADVGCICLPWIEQQQQYAAGRKFTINTMYKLFGRKRKKNHLMDISFQKKKLIHIFSLFLALSLFLFHILNTLCAAKVKSLLSCLRAHWTGSCGKGWEIETSSCTVNSGVKSVRFTQRSSEGLLSFASLLFYHHLSQQPKPSEIWVPLFSFILLMTPPPYAIHLHPLLCQYLPFRLLFHLQSTLQTSINPNLD